MFIQNKPIAKSINVYHLTEGNDVLVGEELLGEGKVKGIFSSPDGSMRLGYFGRNTLKNNHGPVMTLNPDGSIKEIGVYKWTGELERNLTEDEFWEMVNQPDKTILDDFKEKLKDDKLLKVLRVQPQEEWQFSEFQLKTGAAELEHTLKMFRHHMLVEPHLEKEWKDLIQEMEDCKAKFVQFAESKKN